VTREHFRFRSRLGGANSPFAGADRPSAATDGWTGGERHAEGLSKVAAVGRNGHADLPRKLSIGRTTVVGVENDLAEIKGIGPKHAAMLKEIGVDSIKELRHRNAAKLKEMIETRHGKVVGLSEKAVEGWIEAAKAHQE
jgi:predicted flap endonuclease-1-like 5' DNA nuclease